ncbi:MAG TPA: hypothetical protein VMT00_07285 [Thermoanaerobaculia bacterium]|nr:hypothetical protein [Thermoanaerobaculia bacterium]
MRGKAALVFLILVVASLRPIRSYDSFWHLATGRWIVEHRALPLTDPLAVATDPTPWINGEWLFEVLLHAIWSLGGTTAIALARAVLVGAIFALGFGWATRKADPINTLLLAILCWLGAAPLLGERPSAVAALLVLIAVGILLERPSRRSIILYAIVSIAWINLHPSALLAPLLAGAVLLGELAARDRTLRELVRRAIMIASSLAGLLVNPYGIAAITAPIALVATIGKQEFVNVEWSVSLPMQFPLLYVSTAIAIVAFILVRRRELFPRLLVFLFLAVLAFRQVREQPLLYAAYPLLIAPLLPPARSIVIRRVALLALVAALLVRIAGEPPAAGIDSRFFPLRAVAALERSGLGGNIFNADQFGGYLIWTFYPERRVLHDGRNELYSTYLGEYEIARQDGRAWEALLRKYRVALAVEEYRPDRIEVIDAVTRERTYLPASLVYFPRSAWALVAFDDLAMVFARRSEHDPQLLREIEYRHLVPDAPNPSFRDPAAAREELQRAERELGRGRVLERMWGGGR